MPRNCASEEVGEDDHALGFRKSVIIVLAKPGDFEQFGEGAGVAFAVLAHIESGKVEAKDLDLANEGGELSLRNMLFAVREEAILYQQEIGEDFLRGVVGDGGILGFQTFPHEGELATVGFQSGLGAKLMVVAGQERGVVCERVLQLLRYGAEFEGLRVFLCQGLDG